MPLVLMQRYRVMGRTPFYRSLNDVKPHFLNIEQTRMCLSIDDPTQTLEFTKLFIEEI